MGASLTGVQWWFPGSCCLVLNPELVAACTFLWFGGVQIGAVSRLLCLGGVPGMVVRGQSAGWSQLGVIEGEADDPLELVVEGSVELGVLVV